MTKLTQSLPVSKKNDRKVSGSALWLLNQHQMRCTSLYIARRRVTFDGRFASISAKVATRTVTRVTKMNQNVVKV